MSEIPWRGTGSEIRSGTRLERYELQEFLGRRSMGSVYRGYDQSVARSVAIVLLESLGSAESRQRFQSEAPKLMGLHPPHVVELIGTGAYESIPYAVYEYVGGGSLADRVRARRLARDDGLRILSMVADACDGMHRSGVLHGDLSAYNIVFAPDGGPLVFGFGLVPLRDPQPAPDRPSTMAPEQAANGRVTQAADLYSFAAVAHQVLTGSPPSFDAPPPDDVGAEPELRRPRDVGPATYEVLRRGLAQRPESRWPSCTEMVQELVEAVRSDAAPAAVAEEPRRGRGWLYAVIAVLLVLLLAGLGVLLFNRAQPAPTTGITLSETSVQQGGSLIVTGSHLPANQVGTVELESSPQQIGAFQADQNGNVTVRVTIPVTAAPGGHVVSLCWSGACHASAKLTVTERPPTPSPSPSPTPSPTPSASPSPSPSRAPSPSPRPTPTPTSAAASPSPSASPS